MGTDAPKERARRWVSRCIPLALAWPATVEFMGEEMLVVESALVHSDAHLVRAVRAFLERQRPSNAAPTWGLDVRARTHVRIFHLSGVATFRLAELDLKAAI